MRFFNLLLTRYPCHLFRPESWDALWLLLGSIPGSFLSRSIGVILLNFSSGNWSQEMRKFSVTKRMGRAEPEDAHKYSCCRAQEGKAMGAELRWLLTGLAFRYVMFQLFPEKWGTCVGKTIKSARIIYLGFETENLAELFYRKNKC